MTDWFTIRHPTLRRIPFILAAPVHGRMMVMAANAVAESQGVSVGMVVADAKAFLPGLTVIDNPPQLTQKILRALGLWCVRYTPTVAIDLPDGLILDISGCPHLWGGERPYLKTIVTQLRSRGYDARMAIAGTIGMAWAVARYGRETPIVAYGGEADALKPLPPVALRLEPGTIEKLYKLGLRTTGSFMHMPSAMLRRRFGDTLPKRLRQALGQEEEPIVPLQPIPPYSERLPCLEPIRTATGIEIAVQRLLEMLCKRLSGEGKGLRMAILKCHRVDGKTAQVSIEATRATANIRHLLNLFKLKFAQIEPALGIELFILAATKVEKTDTVQEAFWSGVSGLEDTALAELIDRLKGRNNTRAIHRYLPDEHHWPERSIRPATSLGEPSASPWPEHRMRPTRLLSTPEPVEVTAPVPDYPPMLFRFRGEVHAIKKADGPERIEREWWMDKGEHRDYYQVEDDKGRRYWLFRSGHYGDDRPQQWYLHGFFA